MEEVDETNIVQAELAKAANPPANNVEQTNDIAGEARAIDYDAAFAYPDSTVNEAAPSTVYNGAATERERYYYAPIIEDRRDEQGRDAWLAWWKHRTGTTRPGGDDDRVGQASDTDGGSSDDDTGIADHRSSRTPTATRTSEVSVPDNTEIDPLDTPTPTETRTNTATRTPTVANTATRTPTRTNTPDPTNTSVATATPTNGSSTGTAVPTATLTRTPTATSTPAPQMTPTPTRTNTAVPQNTPTPTRTNTPVAATATRTPTPLPATATRTPTRTPTRTATAVAPTPTRTATPPPASGSRNKYEWPFASNSIWNMPIGSNAQYVDAGLEYAGAWNGQITRDDELIGVSPNDPVKTLQGGSNTYRVHVPSWMSHDGSWNGCAVFLDEDGDTIRSGQPLELARGGNPSWEYNYSNAPSGNMSLRGDGRYGCHGGSAMSGIGGSLRIGELDGPDPIRHALKINVWAQRFLSCQNDGYRWPAFRADGYMTCSSYGGNVPAMRMGSLLAILPSVNCETAVSSRHAKKLCQAFQNYGAYVVDDTYWDVYAINIDYNAEFGDGGSFDDDMQELFQMLYVVNNNSATNIGGGGTPRAPLAPPISN